MLGNLAVVFLVLVAVKSDDECGRDAISNCLQSIVTEASVRLRGFPDEAYLNAYCRPATEAAECVRDVLQKCPDMDIADKLPVFESIVSFLHSVCDEGSELKEGYLENVSCYNRTLPQILECGNRAHRLVENFFDSVQDETELQVGQMDQYCIFQPLLVSCIVKESTTLCGAEATVPLTSILNQISSIINEAACPENILLPLQSRLVTYIEEVGFELKKRRK